MIRVAHRSYGKAEKQGCRSGNRQLQKVFSILHGHDCWDMNNSFFSLCITSFKSQCGEGQRKVWEEEPNEFFEFFLREQTKHLDFYCVNTAHNGGELIWKEPIRVPLERGMESWQPKKKFKYLIWLQESLWKALRWSSPGCPKTMPQKERTAANALSLNTYNDTSC